MSSYSAANGQGRTLAIANRAEIAVRIARTARAHDWRPVVLLGDPDLGGYAARQVGAVEPLGPAGSELDVARVVAAAVRAGATALHPGYGFLSERAELSQACREAGITFIGPSPQTLELCGDKVATRGVAEQAGVPLPRAGEPLTLDDPAGWRRSADLLGYPLIAKVAGGGGGRGLRVAETPDALEAAVSAALREAGASGAGQRVYLEHYLRGARHVEVQVAGDGEAAVALGDRDCSIQRRHQKVVEEAPAFGLSPATRKALHAHAVTMARAVGLLGLGTVEFLLAADGELAFIEINPRLQVEHTVTEEVTGLDLVALQLHLAQGGALPHTPATIGHAIQARWYAEDPALGHVPSPGPVRVLTFPSSGDRIDAGYAAGDEVPSAYDPLIAKLIARGADRPAALARLTALLNHIRIAGIATNRPWLLALLADADFASARHTLATAETIQAPIGGPPVEALAAIIGAEREQAGPARDAWAAAGPFRLTGDAVRAFHGDEAGGWEMRVRLRRTVAGYLAHPLPDASGVPLALGAGTVVLPDADGWEVSTPAGRWRVRPGVQPRQHAAAQVLDGAVRAPMPGTIAAVHVAPGDTVAQGAVVCVMLAMKIEIALSAPLGGVVVAVECAPGDLVGSRQALVRIEPTTTKEHADAGT